MGPPCYTFVLNPCNTPQSCPPPHFSPGNSPPFTPFLSREQTLGSTLLKKKTLSAPLGFSFCSDTRCRRNPFWATLMGFMMEKKVVWLQWIVLCSLLLGAVVSSKHHGNPANDIVDIINKNRTSQRLRQLNNSPGLGCIALQFAEECKGNCTTNNTINCHPPEDDFTEVFAPNCGVELPTFGAVSGLIVGCQHKYLEPLQAFSQVLVRDKKSLSLLSNKTHTEIGVGLIRTHKGSYWCVLFSTSERNTSFVLEDLGQGIKQKKGCFSGTSTPCSSSGKRKTSVFFDYTLPVCFLFILLSQVFYFNVL